MLRVQRRLRLLSARFDRMWRAGRYSELDELGLKRRAEHLAARLPVLYYIFAATALLIVFVFLGTASVFQTVLAPFLYVAVCVKRARYWTSKAVANRDLTKLRCDINRL